jgi:hypothetical protein
MLPSTMSVKLFTERSPTFVAKNLREWCFVEYDVDGSYRPLDCTCKPQAGKDADVQVSSAWRVVCFVDNSTLSSLLVMKLKRFLEV